MNITEMNVDDYIRDERRNGTTVIFWSKKNWKILSRFVEAATSPITEYGMPYGRGYKIKEGDTFMGIINYLLNEV